MSGHTRRQAEGRPAFQGHCTCHGGGLRGCADLGARHGTWQRLRDGWNRDASRRPVLLHVYYYSRAAGGGGSEAGFRPQIIVKRGGGGGGSGICPPSCEICCCCAMGLRELHGATLEDFPAVGKPRDKPPSLDIANKRPAAIKAPLHVVYLTLQPRRATADATAAPSPPLCCPRAAVLRLIQHHLVLSH